MRSVLFVCNYRAGVGGISGQVEILQRKLREEGCVADIFSTKTSVWKRLLLLRPQLRRAAKAYDIIHVHCCSGWGFLPAVFGVSVGGKLGKRVILTYHGGGGDRFFKRHPRLVQHYLTKTDTNIVLSGFLAGVFQKHGLPYTVIPNIIEFDDDHFRQRDTIQPNFICTRAHEPLYNIISILKAFQRVQRERPEATLTLVGDGSQHQQLMQQSERMGLQHVRFTGRVDNKEIYHYLNQADIILSAPIADNMPVSLLEAMNAGLLVISSRVGGVPYMIDENETGLLFTSGSDEELAERMRWAVSKENNNKVKEILIQANHKVCDYRWENVKVKILMVYEQ